jgi:hypothetical protein
MRVPQYITGFRVTAVAVTLVIMTCFLVAAVVVPLAAEL